MSDLLKAYGSDPARGACNSIGQPERISQVREPNRKSPKDVFCGVSTPNLISLRDKIDEEIRKRTRTGKRFALPKNKLLYLDTALAAYIKVANLFADTVLQNASGLFDIPELSDARPETLATYLPSLISQNWSHLYNYKEAENSSFYVYAHIDPRARPFICIPECGGEWRGVPFYIGKGIGNRAFDLKRNQGHGQILRTLLREGYDASSLVKIVFQGLSEEKAFELEAKLIYFFGTVYQKHRNFGTLYNLDIPPVPIFSGLMKTLPCGVNIRKKFG